MPLLPIAPPQLVSLHRGFDWVAVDASRHRVYAAHTVASTLVVVDADSGKVLRQILIGSVQGLAVDPRSGHVYTGNGTNRSVSEVDPKAAKVVRQVSVAGSVDALAYDPALHRVYADEDDGNRIFVIDARSMKQIDVVALPGSKPEAMAIDPASHDIYQNIGDAGEYVIVDPKTLHVKRVVNTPELSDNHPLQFDPVLDRVIVGGGGTLSVYDRHGTRHGALVGMPFADQCDLDVKTHRLACAGGGKLGLYAIASDKAPSLITQISIPAGAHTLAIDPRTSIIWLVWSGQDGDFVQGYRLKS